MKVHSPQVVVVVVKTLKCEGKNYPLASFVYARVFFHNDHCDLNVDQSKHSRACGSRVLCVCDIL